MKPMNLDQVVRNIDRRLERVEQILPTLPTRDEMHEAVNTAIRDAVAPLVTREELDRKLAGLATRPEMHAAIQKAVAPLATKEALEQTTSSLSARMDALDRRITEEAERSRTYTKIHYEDLKDGIRLLADGVVKVQITLDRVVVPKLDNHKRRITALEGARGPEGGSLRR